MIEADEDAMDKILEATGFSAESRQLTRKLRPSLEYSREGTKFNVKYIDGEHVATQSFELDKEFEQTMIDGRKSKVGFLKFLFLFYSSNFYLVRIKSQLTIMCLNLRCYSPAMEPR